MPLRRRAGRFALWGAIAVGAPNFCWGLYQYIYVDPHMDVRLGLGGVVSFTAFFVVAGAFAGLVCWAILSAAYQYKSSKGVEKPNERDMADRWPPAPKGQD